MFKRLYKYIQRALPQRHHFLISKTTQLSLMLLFLAVGFIHATIATYFLYSMMDDAISTVMFQSHLKIKTMGELLLPIVVTVNSIYIVVFLVVTTVLVWLLLHAVNIRLLRFKVKIDKAADFEFDEMNAIWYEQFLKPAFDAYNGLVKATLDRFGKLDGIRSKMSHQVQDEDNPDLDGLMQNVELARNTLKSISESVGDNDVK